MAIAKELSLPAELRKLEASNIAQKTNVVTKSRKDVMTWIEELFDGRRLQLDIIVMLMHSMDKPADEILIWNDKATQEEIISQFNGVLKKLGYKLKGDKWILKSKKSG
jgi:hypothetical protein